MNILSQAIQIAQEKMSKSFSETLELYLSPLNWNPSSLNYASLIEELDMKFHQLARDSLIELLENMDKQYRDSKARKDIYYIKNTRKRSLVTLFGLITYCRTEYQNKITGESFCYIDRKIGLEKRVRYDPVICCLAYEMYADHNSMIKVGKLLGDRIYGFSLNSKRNYEAIPRQTIWRMLNRFKEISIPIIPREKTPSVLYIMADEKFIALQGKDKPSSKLMNKLGVCFEGIEENDYRPSLNKPYYFYYQEGSFWPQLFESLSMMYDINQIKELYILGDGATWIKAGTSEFDHSQFGLCKFHFQQAVNHITDDPKIKHMIINYAIHHDTYNLKILFTLLLEDNPSRQDVLQQKFDYILNNLKGIHTMYSKIKIGCPMEQVIQHVLQSPFTSIPKAYSHKYLPTYISSRIHHQNHFDLRKIYLTALDSSDNKSYVNLSNTYHDFTLSDKNSSKPTYSIHLPYSGALNKY